MLFLRKIGPSPQSSPRRGEEASGAGVAPHLNPLPGGERRQTLRCARFFIDKSFPCAHV
jgi:hypothetical protein